MREGLVAVRRLRSRLWPSKGWAGDPERKRRRGRGQEMKRYSDRCRDWARDCCSSGGNADLDLHRGSGGVSSVGASGGSVRITHLVSAVPGSGTGGTVGGHATSGVTANAASGAPRFPKLDECAHFHYENVELGPVQVSLCEEELKPLSDPDGVGGGNENRSWVVQVTSLGRSWLLRRSYDNFRMLDCQLHRCVYDRKFSALPELPSEANVPTANPDQPIEEAVRCLLTEYLSRLTCLAGGGSGGNTAGSASLINCGPVLNWLELDNRGHRLLVTDDSDINTPAVAAAYAVRRYTAQAPDEISFEVGDMISVIDMPPPEESIWWRGKRGFEVGFFPCECVALIGEKVPRSLLHQLVPASSQQPSASPPSIAANTGPSSPPAAVTPASSCASTASSSPSPASSAIVVASPSSQPGRPLPSKPVLRKHGKLIAFFRSFILSRPSRRRLKQSGILKERVFGCDLGEHLLNSGHEIPMVLKCCAEFIETNGIVDGIYRLSGVTSNIQKLRNAFDEDRVPGLYEDEAILQDIHSVASLLKMYFRELPNPLCTYHLYHRFVGAVQAPHENRLALMREVVKSLPPPHYRTLEYLMKHLARVAQRGGETGMTPRNVAIVWAPNLLRCKELEVGGVAALQGVGVQAVVTEFLVCYADLIFGVHEKGALAQRLRQRPGQHLSPEQHKLPPDVSPNLVAAFAAENATPKRSRPKSLAISTPTKLLSLEEARTRALLAATGKADQEYIEVGGGPANLPAKYHTVIDVPARKRGSLKSKRSPGLGWKAFFSKKIPIQQRQQSSSSLTSKRNILGGGFSPGASGAAPSSQLRGMVSPSELRTQEKAMTEGDLMQNKRRLRPVKSAESLSSAVASAGSSTRNSAALDLEIGLGSIEGVLDQITGQSSSVVIGDNGLPSSPSVTGKPSHSRSVSHDSYFDHLAEPVLLMTEEDDVERDEDGDLRESENLEGLLDLSEIQLDFELEEREMRIFSEDETLVSTTPIGSGGSLSRSPLLPHPTRRRLIGSPQGSGPRARPEDTGSSADPSPKKKKSGISAISPGARKRSKVEAKSQATATSSSPSPVSSPVRSAPLRPPSSSMPSIGQRSCFGADDEDEEEELRFIDSQSPEPMPPSTTSFHGTSPSYMSRQSSHSPSSNIYSQPYQQQQVVVHAEVHPSPSEDASSLSRADATVSDNESFTVHGGETSSEGDLPAEGVGAHHENEEEEDDEDEGGVLYTPLVNDATAETTPVEQSTPAYENVPWVRGQTGALNGDDQITTNLLEKRKCPAAAPRNLDSAPIGRVYQNIGSSYSDNHDEANDEAVYEEVQVVKDKSDSRRNSSPLSNVTRRSDIASNSLKNNASKNGDADPEEVYQQVKAFRKSVQEVNEILGGGAEETQLPKMDGRENKTLGSDDSVQNSRDASSAGNEPCAIVKDASANSESLSSSNGSSEESSEGRVPSEEMALLRTPSGRSGLSVSGANRRASLPAPSTNSFTEDSHRRRFDSEIGRDILRERRVKLELERVRGEPGSGVSSPVSSDGTGTRLTPSPVSTPQRTLSPAPPKSPASMYTSDRHSPAPSSASTAPPHSPVPPQSPAPPRSPASSSSPVPSHSPAPSRSPAFSHSPAPPRSPAHKSSSPAPVHSPAPSCSPVFSRSPAPPLSPASPHSPAPPISPASPHSPLPARSPLSPLPPYSPISHSPALSPISPLNSPLTPKSPLYPIALSPTNSANSPTHVVSTSVGASCLRSPTIPMDFPSGPNSSSSSPARTAFKKNDEGHRSVSVGTSLTDVSDGVKNSSAKKDSSIKTLENGFESGCQGWGSEGGSLRGLPGRSWSVSDSRRLAVRKASVRELLTRFEGKEGGEGEEKGGRRASAPSHRRPTPPCLRARASRSSPASALSVSLDEERFLASAREAKNSPSKSGEIPSCNESPSKGDGQLIRVRTSPDINTEADDSEEQSLLMEQQSDSTDISSNKAESSETHSSQVKMETSISALQAFSGPDDPERRERIERYKRERRSFLREKYRSESFREERDEVLKRLKQKVSSVPPESREIGSEGECRSRRRTRCTLTEGDPADDESKTTMGKLSSRSRWRATSSESDEAGEGVPRVGVSPVLSRSPNCRYGGVPASPTLSLGTPWDVAALFEAREQREKVEKGEKSRELP